MVAGPQHLLIIQMSVELSQAVMPWEHTKFSKKDLDFLLGKSF